MSTENNNIGDTVQGKPTVSSGSFARSFVSLQLQINTLLEESGGAAAVGLLDALSTLNRSEQARAIAVCTNAIRRISESDERLETAADADLKSFEEGLYNDIISAMRDAACGHEHSTMNGSSHKGSPRSGPALAVVHGGKSAQNAVSFRAQNLAHKKPIDLAAARRNRQSPEA